MSDYALGIDLGGSSVKTVAVDPAGAVLLKKNVSFRASQPKAWAERIRDLVQELERESGGAAKVIGLSAPGLAARDQRSIAYMPGRLHGLEGLNWTEFLQRAEQVSVLNDAHAALSGEAWIGAAAGLQNVFMLTLGTGVGGAAIVDGHLLRGAIGRAGHLGHICLNPDGARDITNTPGSLELAIGNCTIRERTNGRFKTTHDLVEACLAEDKLAKKIWLKSVRALACAVVSLVNVLDPEAVIIGGGIARAGNALFEPLESFLEELEWRPGGQAVKVIPAHLGELAGAIGAARSAMLMQASRCEADD